MRFVGAQSVARLAALLLVAAAIMLPAGAGAQDAPKLLGKFDDWSAFTYGSGNDRICYALSEPVRTEPSNVKRGDIFFIVTNRPASKVRGEISMRIGYVFGKNSQPYISVGSARFPMFTGASKGGESAHWAWLQDANDENKLLAAMRAGADMKVEGTSLRGTRTTDTYSLYGISAALKRIDEECK